MDISNHKRYDDISVSLSQRLVQCAAELLVPMHESRQVVMVKSQREYYAPQFFLQFNSRCFTILYARGTSLYSFRAIGSFPITSDFPEEEAKIDDGPGFWCPTGVGKFPRKPQGKWDSGTFESIQGVNHEGAFVFETVESAANRLNTHLPPLTHILYSYRRDNFLSLTSNGFHQNAKGKAYDARFDPNIELAMEEGQTALLS